jgi:hypothetical protein
MKMLEVSPQFVDVETVTHCAEPELLTTLKAS